MANAGRSSWLGGPSRPGDEAQEIDFDKLPASGDDSLAAGGIDGPRDADAQQRTERAGLRAGLLTVPVLGEVSVQQCDRHCAFSHSRGHPLDRAVSHVAGDEQSGLARLKRQRVAR